MECRLCGSEELKKVYRGETLYYYCYHCDIIFIEENEFPDPETELERYQQHDNTHENEGYVAMFQKFIGDFIIPYHEKMGNKVLEFGCGPGPVLADLLEDKGFEVDKYDPYFFSEKIFKNKNYDLITATEVWEHLQDPYHTIQFLVNHLQDKGFLAVMTSFHPGPEEFKDWWYPWDPTHIVFYNKKTLAWIAREFNLDIIKIDEKKHCLFQKL